MKNHQTNFLIETDDGKRMLLDCGGDARFSLGKQGLTYLDIDAIYISHLHNDHVGGMEWMAFATYFDPRYKGRPLLFCQRQMMQDLWDKSLRGGLEGIEGKDATLDEYFDLNPVDPNGSFTFGEVTYDIVQTVHVSAKYRIMDSYGLMFNGGNGERIYITTDVQFAPETSLKAYYAEADIIVHDCETAPFMSGVHAHYDQLCTLSPEVKKKMLLIHYHDNVVENWAEWKAKAKADGFKGFIKGGRFYLAAAQEAAE
jgi:ribonuclease BN (tRNA processing enzyme)